MKTLITYYSRTGNTRKVGQAIAKNLKADTDEIIDEKSRKGIFGWLGGGRDAFLKRLTSIKDKKQPESYDLVIIGTPVWAGSMVPAVRTYLREHKPKKVAFYCTYGGQPAKTFPEMRMESKKPLATLGLKQDDLDNQEAIKAFCKKVTSR